MKSAVSRIVCVGALLIMLIGASLPIYGQELDLGSFPPKTAILNDFPSVPRSPIPLVLTPTTGLAASVNSLTPEIPVDGRCTGNFTGTIGGKQAEICAEYSITVSSDVEAVLIELEFGSSGRNLNFGFNFGRPVSEVGSFKAFQDFGNASQYSSVIHTIGHSDLETGTLFIAVINFESHSQQYTFTTSLTPVALSSGVPHEGSIYDNTLGGRSPGPGRILGFIDYMINASSTNQLLRIRLENRNSSGNIDLAVRFGQPVDVQGGRLVADFVSQGSGGSKTVEISPRSSPPLQAGTYYISVLNSESTRQRFTLTATIEAAPQDQPPKADFSFSPANPTTNDTVQFSDRSSDPDGQIVAWTWDFGDGNSSSQQNPTHRYSNAGTYTVKLTVTDNGNLTDSASKSITVTSKPTPPALEVTPQQLPFSARIGDPNPTGTLTVRNTGGGTLNWTARADATWLQLAPVQGALGAGQSQAINVTAVLTGLAAGTYQGTITVEAPGVAMVAVQVTLNLQQLGQPPSTGPLVVQPASLSFNAQAGGSNPERQELVLTNNGSQTLAWGADVKGDWLFLSIASGTLRSGEQVTLQVWPEIAGLAAGTYTGQITFSAPRNPQIQPVTVPVTLTVGPTPPPGAGELLALKFVKLEFVKPADWDRTLSNGCVVYKNISTGPSTIRVTLPDNSTQEFAIPSGKEVIVCGDVAHIDTRH